MKLGISYNLWDGTELLKSSILSVRNSVDFISIIFQDESNFGKKKEGLQPLLSSLLKDKLIDEVYHYKTDLTLLPHQNELIKRNLGISLSRFNKCTHHLSIDVDEFYNNQFSQAKEYIEENKINVSVCQMQSYYKYPTLQITPPEDYYVSFIFKVEPRTCFILNQQYPVLVDTTRRVPVLGSFKMFGRDELEMHNFSYVRKNIRQKLESSTANCNFVSDIETLVNHYENFSEGDQALFAGNPCIYHHLQKVSNQFNITL